MTPEQMRALADKPAEFFARHQPEWMQQSAAALRAAADEVDRLRAENHAKDVVLLARDLKEQELRAVIDNAPHDSRCTIHPAFGYTPNCTCWKAEAL